MDRSADVPRKPLWKRPFHGNRRSGEAQGPSAQETGPTKGSQQLLTRDSKGGAQLRINRLLSNLHIRQLQCNTSGVSTLVEIVSAENLPDMQILSTTDPYVQVRITRGGWTSCSPRCWPRLLNTLHPVWRMKRVLNAPLSVSSGALGDDLLLLRVYDQATSCLTAVAGADFLGTACISVQELANTRPGELVRLPIELHGKAKKNHEDSPYTMPPQDARLQPTMSLRWWPDFEFQRWPTRKWFFIVRHAESMWNVAEQMKRPQDIGILLRKIDHELSAEGIRQAQQLAEKIRRKLQPEPMVSMKSNLELEEVYREFLSVGAIYVSPLCRALQTALVATQYHPIAKLRGLTLRSELREKKTAAGRDSRAARVGLQIVQRAVSLIGNTLREYEDDAVADEIMKRVQDIPVDTGNTSHEWWGTAAESSERLDRRIKEIFVQLKFEPFDKVLIVTHSFLFKTMLQNHVSEECRADDPELIRLLAKKRLQNCGVVALRVDFTQGVACCIKQVKLLFDTPPPG